MTWTQTDHTYSVQTAVVNASPTCRPSVRGYSLSAPFSLNSEISHEKLVHWVQKVHSLHSLYNSTCDNFITRSYDGVLSTV